MRLFAYLTLVFSIFLVAALFWRFDMHPNPWAVTFGVLLILFFLIQFIRPAR